MCSEWGGIMMHTETLYNKEAANEVLNAIRKNLTNKNMSRRNDPYLPEAAKDQKYTSWVKFEAGNHQFIGYLKPEAKHTGIRSTFNHPAYLEVYGINDRIDGSPIMRLLWSEVDQVYMMVIR